METEKKNGPGHLNIILILSFIILWMFIYFLNDARLRLNNTNELLKVTIGVAIKGGISADSLHKEYMKVDSLLNK